MTFHLVIRDILNLFITIAYYIPFFLIDVNIHHLINDLNLFIYFLKNLNNFKIIIKKSISLIY